MQQRPRLWIVIAAALSLLLVGLGVFWLTGQSLEPATSTTSETPAAIATPATQQAEAAGPSSVTVRVLAEGRPVAEVGVLLQHAARAEVFFTERTDKQGEARFSAVPGGTYQMTTMHLAYAPRSRTVSVTQPRQTLSITLEEPAKTDSTEVAGAAAEGSRAQGVLKGRVSDGQGMPIASAQVGASGQGSPRFTSSNADGHFELSGLAGGDVNVFATAQEFAPLHLQKVPIGTSNLELIMQPAAEVSGTLTFSQPLDMLYVKLCRFEPLHAKEVCVRNEYYRPPQTTYQLGRTPAGKFSLVFSDGERELHRVAVQIEPGQRLQVPPQAL